MNENKSGNKKSLRQHFSEWLGMLAVGAVMLFFFAPDSWWQFGVSPLEKRIRTANFSLKTLNNENWNFQDRRGKVLVVNYWATWCAPCRFETPSLVGIFNEYKARGVELVGVSVDENPSDIPPFIEEYKISYPILLPGNDPNVGAEGLALPTTFLYDKNGRLAKKYTGIVLESTLRSDIEKLLKEQ